jgi:2-phospho-L-lactate guanylyltransferase
MSGLDILIPCKGFARGKSRLAPAMSAEERAALCRGFLERTLDVAAELAGRIAVVTDDPEVRAMASAAGAVLVDDPGRGLNAALRRANVALAAASRGSDLLVLPTDLPLADTATLRRLLGRPAQMTIAPDLQGHGTNLLRLGALARREFPFAYGLGSFGRHVDIAAERGLTLSVFRDERTGFDVDEPLDLAAWSRGAHQPS